MKLHTDLSSDLEIKNAVLTIGTFDGVHIGHQKILQRVFEEAKKNEGESVLFTFFPHPKMILNPLNHGVELIQTRSEKYQKLADLGLQHLIEVPFTRDFSNLTAEEFIEDFLVKKIKIKTLIIGYDHQFGKDRKGDIHFLLEVSKKYGFEVIEIPAQEIDAINVSSTKIRNALTKGDVHTANAYLKSPFQLAGIVTKGQQIGRTIGFPTANILVDDPLKIKPKLGVYFVEVQIDQQLCFGMLNIGIRPTVDQSNFKTIEVHIFDFKEDIYGKQIVLTFIERIRDEQKFESLSALINQLQKDEVFCRSYIANHLS